MDVELGEAAPQCEHVGAARSVRERAGRRAQRDGDDVARELDPRGERSDSRRRHGQPPAGRAAETRDFAAVPEYGHLNPPGGPWLRANHDRGADKGRTRACRDVELWRDRQPGGRGAEPSYPGAPEPAAAGQQPRVEAAGAVGSSQCSRPATPCRPAARARPVSPAPPARAPRGRRRAGRRRPSPARISGTGPVRAPRSWLS